MIKNFTAYTNMAYLIMPLTVLTFVLAAEGAANATTRDEAQKVLFVLRQTGVAETAPDEMRSVDASFSEAEGYYQQKNHEMSDRYFLLTIQKARILLAKVLDRISDAPATDAQQPPNIIVASIPPVLPDSVPPPRKPDNTPLVQQPVLPAPTVGAQQGETGHSPDDVISDKLVGKASIYTVVRHDTLRLVAAKLGVSRYNLARLNNLDLKAPLRVGQKLKYNNRKIIPQRMTNGIVINIPDRTLYYFKEGKLAASLPVALGVPKKSEKYDWKTPIGRFKITAKQKDPTWHVPPSIQSEMEEEGKDIIASVAPGPQNPLGKYAIRTSLPGIMIHSTTKPGSIYSFSSHGCIRLYPEHMEGFFKEVKVNTPGEIIYRPVKLAVTESGRIFMEVHQDAYGTGTGLNAAAKKLIEKQNLSDRVDWEKVEALIKEKTGIAEDVTL